jgi:hypothetical protein
MSQLDVNVIAPLGYTGPTLPGDNNFVQIVDNTGDTILKLPGNDNTAIGKDALEANTTGARNIAIGTSALSLNTTAPNNVAIGYEAMKNSTGNKQNSVAIGFRSLISGATGSVAIGSAAGSASTQTITAVGSNALPSSTGASNTGVGYQAGFQYTTGSNNTFLGFLAASGNVTTGSKNTCLGSISGVSIDGDNNTCIGYNAQVSGGGASNEFILGDANIAVLSCAQTTITSLSDARDKKEVEELPVGLDFVQKLKPVKFVWDDRNEEGKHDIKDFGFIAQDLKAAQEEEGVADYLKLVYEANPDKLQASYGKLIPILVKAIQELSEEVKQLKNK